MNLATPRTSLWPVTSRPARGLSLAVVLAIVGALLSGYAALARADTVSQIAAGLVTLCLRRHGT